MNALADGSGPLLMGPLGYECNGDGTCAPARLHRAGKTCKACGSDSFDHETHTPNKAFCLACGQPYIGEDPSAPVKKSEWLCEWCDRPVDPNATCFVCPNGREWNRATAEDLRAKAYEIERRLREALP